MTRPGTAGVVGIDLRALEEVVARALAEDLGPDAGAEHHAGAAAVGGDVTTDGLIPSGARCRAGLLLREPGVVCGLPAAEATFRALDPSAQLRPLVREGDWLDQPATVATVEGTARAVLAGERTALNLLGRLSGVATSTRSFVEAVEGTGAVVLDTRKTTPGLRALEKYATRTGGAQNHRSGLYDAVLVKDNHLRLAGGAQAAVAALRAVTSLPIEVEVESLEEVTQALEAGADVLLLDNMPLGDLAQAVVLTAGRARLEASGGVSLENVAAVARTGVDFVSIGAITHSARSLDVSLEVL